MESSLFPRLLPDLKAKLHSCKIKYASGLGRRLYVIITKISQADFIFMHKSLDMVRDLCYIYMVSFILQELSSTERGAGGFGSTGN